MPVVEHTIINATDVRWDEALHRERWCIHVTFEQGRGRGGVPRVNIPSPRNASVDELTQIAVHTFRVLCVNNEEGHGRDLMPGTGHEGYELHDPNGGGVIEKPEDILWVKREGGYVARLILTWGEPNRLLMKEIRA